MLLRVIPALVCITLHELAHGYVAYRLGDTTARDAGRLTLNPFAAHRPYGACDDDRVSVRLGKAGAVNMYRFRDPKRGMAITSLAGPACNILLGIVALFLYGLLYLPLWMHPMGKVGPYVLEMVYLTAYLSVALAVFNLLPIPPLDGSKILFALIPDRAYAD